jgi:hypothetical protein
MGASKGASVLLHHEKKGLAREGKTFNVILKSWVEPRKTINRA